jgi:hypothetical protein
VHRHDVGRAALPVITGIFNPRMKREELERENMQVALKMAELKHQQSAGQPGADPAGEGRGHRQGRDL